MIARREAERAEAFSLALQSVRSSSNSQPEDVLRLGVTFAHEVTSLSHQLTKLSQEMQNSVISFQMEGSDTLSSMSPLRENSVS